MIIFSLLIPLLLGWAVVNAVAQKKPLWETLALSFVIGWGLNVIIMFALSALKIPLTLINILLADSVLGVCLLIARKPPRLIAGFRLKPSLFGYMLFAIIGLKSLLILWSVLIKPIIDPDLLICYTLTAKMIFLNGCIPAGWPIGDQPLLPSLSQAWPAIVINRWDDSLLTAANPFLFLSFITIFFSALARSGRQRLALVGTLLLGTIPFLVFHAGTAYGDFLQTVYFSAATLFLFLFLKYRQRDDLLIGMVVLGISVWAKRSGIYYAGIDLAMLAVFLPLSRLKVNWRRWLLPVLLFVLLAAPWVIDQAFLTIKYYAVQAASTVPAGTTSQNFIQALLRNTFFEDNWHLLGIGFLATLLLYPKKAFASPRAYLLSIIILQFLSLFVIAAFTERSAFILDETMLNRHTLPLIPVILFYCLEVIGAGEAKPINRKVSSG